MIDGSVAGAGPGSGRSLSGVSHLSEPTRRLGSCGKNRPGPTSHDGYPQLTSILNRRDPRHGVLTAELTLRIARAGASRQGTSRSFPAIRAEKMAES